MTHEELLVREGADFFGNRLIYKGRDVGVKTPGSALVLLPEGEDVVAELANITDVEVKPAKKARAKPATEVDIDNLSELLE